ITYENRTSLIVATTFESKMEKHEKLSVTLKTDKSRTDVYTLKIFKEKYETLIDTTTYYIPTGDRYELQIKHFVENCLEENLQESNMNEGVQLQSIINGFYESAEKKAPIYLR